MWNPYRINQQNLYQARIEENIKRRTTNRRGGQCRVGLRKKNRRNIEKKSDVISERNTGEERNCRGKTDKNSMVPDENESEV